MSREGENGEKGYGRCVVRATWCEVRGYARVPGGEAADRTPTSVVQSGWVGRERIVKVLSKARIPSLISEDFSGLSLDLV